MRKRASLERMKYAMGEETELRGCQGPALAWRGVPERTGVWELRGLEVIGSKLAA